MYVYTKADVARKSILHMEQFGNSGTFKPTRIKALEHCVIAVVVWGGNMTNKRERIIHAYIHD